MEVTLMNAKIISKDILEYNGYQAKIDVDMTACVVYGRVINLERDSISFESTTLEGIEAEFVDTIDEYLKECAEDDIAADVPKIAVAA